MSETAIVTDVQTLAQRFRLRLRHLIVSTCRSPCRSAIGLQTEAHHAEILKLLVLQHTSTSEPPRLYLAQSSFESDINTTQSSKMRDQESTPSNGLAEARVGRKGGEGVCGGKMLQDLPGCAVTGSRLGQACPRRGSSPVGPRPWIQTQ